MSPPASKALHPLENRDVIYIAATVSLSDRIAADFVDDQKNILILHPGMHDTLAVTRRCSRLYVACFGGWSRRLPHIRFLDRHELPVCTQDDPRHEVSRKLGQRRTTEKRTRARLLVPLNVFGDVSITRRSIANA